MITAGEDELICDMAETYQVFDYRALPLSLASTLAAGLRSNSRIKLKMSGHRCGVDTMLSAMTVDRLSYILWSRTKDAQHGRNKPESVLELLLSGKKENDIRSFESSEEFESEWNRRIMEAENA